MKKSAKKKILIVEDEEYERNGLVALLSDHNFEIKAVANGHFALEQLQSEVFDLVITDIMMPATDGLTFLHKLRSSGSKVPVLVMTGNENMQNMLSAYQLGALDVIYKPFAFSEMIETIRRVLPD